MGEREGLLCDMTPTRCGGHVIAKYVGGQPFVRGFGHRTTPCSLHDVYNVQNGFEQLRVARTDGGRRPGRDRGARLAGRRQVCAGAERQRGRRRARQGHGRYAGHAPFGAPVAAHHQRPVSGSAATDRGRRRVAAPVLVSRSRAAALRARGERGETVLRRHREDRRPVGRSGPAVRRRRIADQMGGGGLFGKNDKLPNFRLNRRRDEETRQKTDTISKYYNFVSHVSYGFILYAQLSFFCKM